jgi:hypothetical protein
MLDQVLEKLNLNFDDLNAVERETLLNWMSALQAKTLSVDSIKEHVQQMTDSVQAELAGFTEPKTIWEFLFSKRKDIYRRARLRNYLLLLAFLTGPEKAQKAIERSLTNIKQKY